MKEWELKELKVSPEEEGEDGLRSMEDIWPRDIQTVEEWLADCESGMLIDYDGVGEMLIQEGDVFIPQGRIWPSIRDEIPSHITHIEWFNK